MFDIKNILFRIVDCFFPFYCDTLHSDTISLIPSTFRGDCLHSSNVLYKSCTIINCSGFLRSNHLLSTYIMLASWDTDLNKSVVDLFLDCKCCLYVFCAETKLFKLNHIDSEIKLCTLFMRELFP